MSWPLPIKGVYLSSTIDLKAQFGPAFESVSATLCLYTPEEIMIPAEIKFALSWNPADNAFEPYPNLEMVSSIGAGVDSILSCRSLPESTIITRIDDPNQAYELAEYAVWQVIWYHRNMSQYFINQSNHLWQWVERVPNRNCTVGILGFGRMGRAIARALIPLGFPIVAARRTNRQEPEHPGITIFTGAGSIRDTAARSNILINVLPLTSETRHILNEDLFQVMPKASVLIQIGRGEHLNPNDLISALDAGHLSAATLDVFQDEPLPLNHAYWDDQRIMVTPHDASESDITVVVQQVTASVTDVAQGRIPAYTVDRDRGY